jgi:hypothetical protein
VASPARQPAGPPDFSEISAGWPGAIGNAEIGCRIAEKHYSSG